MIVSAYPITVVAVFALSPFSSTCTATGLAVRTARPRPEGITTTARTSFRFIRRDVPDVEVERVAVEQQEERRDEQQRHQRARVAPDLPKLLPSDRHHLAHG